MATRRMPPEEADERLWCPVDTAGTIRLEARVHHATPSSAASASPRPLTLILAHAWGPLGGRMTDNVLVAVRRRYPQCTIVRFHFRGTGQSSGWPSLTASAEREDVVAVCRWVASDFGALARTAPPPPRERPPVLLLGYSFGSAMMASALPDLAPWVAVRALVLVSFPYSVLWALTCFGHRRILAHLAQAAAAAAAADHGAAPGTATTTATAANDGIKLLLLIGEHDSFTAPWRLEAFAMTRCGAQRGPLGDGEPAAHTTYWPIPGCDHFWHGRESRLLEALDRWLMQQRLLPTSAS
ncbi:hypothetical protein CXG81DRAFT_23369 [Caulochytrium protostelioides]|uniref:AB hydrolase-1 domain-containing protein n=1 Tax=Caulochytrium protostelioides TaxID=1555241 RepID=A0A4P9XEI1_9FUNG|nr:hypothetical protein CXG81DRAFT_23369 [Caulochytrium protostelioides]|eukprot:RKP03956.1 hypothetical protein CXG81DRAFT_23369 [Caulochytrium protostelioides]